MHIHKIDSTFPEHQNFLTQNRKDPITGDSILEGDEVVFCAGCKSVFLKDTWEYLGKQHCEQTKTLKILPSTPIHIRVGEDILYYQFIEQDNETGVLEIRNDYKNWLYKEAHTGKFHNLFYGKKKKLYQFGVGFGLFLLLIPLNLLVANEVFIVFSSAVLIGLFPTLKFFHQENYETKINTKYSKITSKAFIIKPQGITISEPYGIRENFLSNKHIKAITLSKLDLFLFSKELIFEYEDNEELVIPISNDRERTLDLLHALAQFSTNLPFPITLYIDNALEIEEAKKLVIDKEAKFTIEKRQDYLMEKYKKLQAYKNKLKALTKSFH